MKDKKVLHLRINSPGGDVDEARAIQTGLNQSPCQIIGHIDGIAASAATLPMLATDEIEMSEGARVMIHNAWGFVVGNKTDMRKCADSLESIDAAIANDYVQKTGQTLAQVQYWMNEETEFMAADALKFGFIDRIYKPEAPKKETQNKIDNDDERIYAERELELIELGI
jgi:ATP-dependent Clp protease protease subunit